MVGSYPVFNMGYAVAAGYGGHKLVESTLVAGFAGLSAGLAGARIPIIQGEAVIRPDDLASQAAARVIYAAAPEPITDSVSGEPAPHYNGAVACDW